MSGTSSRVVINDDGRLYLETTTSEEIRAVPELLRSASDNNSGTLIPSWSRDQYMFVTPKYLVAIRAFDKLEVIGNWAVNEGTDNGERKLVLRPAWASSTRGLRFDKKFEFTTPEGIMLTFSTVFSHGGDNMGSHCHSLDLEQDGRGGCYHPLIPNVYGNGGICFGGVQLPQFDKREGLDHYLNEVFEVWADGEWNADLNVLGLGTPDGIPRWFSFDPETGEHLNSEERTIANFRSAVPNAIADTGSADHDVVLEAGKALREFLIDNPQEEDND